ncbi:MAG: DUF4397 domain-containing protein [Gemmatimonadota bacterium]|nr:MAG: DUF4397 domain-containing protein [Gemmatimonadota bacterium]
MMNRKPALLTAALMALVLVISACDDDDETTGPNPPIANAVALRAVHASPGAPAVDIYANDGTTPLVQDLAYGEATSYLDIPEGTYNIQLRAAGSAASSAPVYETGDLTLSEGQIVTALATGFLGSSDAADEFRVIPLFEEFDAAASGKTRVRIVHASPDAPTVAVDVGNDGSPEVAALARFEDTGVAGVELPSGSALQIGIWAGTPLERVTAFTTPQLPDGGELFVIAAGSLELLPREAAGFALFAIAGYPGGAIGQATSNVSLIRQNPTVYALHGGPDAPAVDIFAGDSELVDNLSFADLSGGIQVPPGVYTLDFFPTSPGSDRPAGSPAASFDTPNLNGGERYLAIATGFLSPDAAGEQPFNLVAFRDAFELNDLSNSRIQAIHASPDAPAVDIGTVNGGGTIEAVVFENLIYPAGKPDAGESVPATDLTLGVAATGDDNPIVTFDVSTLAGLRAYAVAIGALNPDAVRSRSGWR